MLEKRNPTFDYIYDIENDQRVKTVSKIGKQIILNYQNQLKNKPVKSVRKLYKKITIVDISDSLYSDFLAYISLLYFELEQIKTFKTVNNRNRLNLEPGKRMRSTHFGLKCWNGEYSDCVSNEREPEIYELLIELQQKCLPGFEWNQILVNKNQTFKPHKDGNNLKSKTLIFSIGDYEGDLHIEGWEVNTKIRPIIFDGKNVEHSVPEIKGNRYSVLYYMI